MKKILYRIFSVFLVIALLVSSISSTFAAGPVAEYVAGTFFDVIAGQLVSEGIDYIKDFIGYSAGKECESSSDGYHHCEKAAFGHGTGGTNENGRYSLVSCKYCGETFKFYSSGGFGSGGGGFSKSDLQQSYEAQVEELPATGYSSDGGLLIPTEITSHKFNRASSWPQNSSVCNNHTLSSDSIGASEVRFSCS